MSKFLKNAAVMVQKFVATVLAMSAAAAISFVSIYLLLSHGPGWSTGGTAEIVAFARYFATLLALLIAFGEYLGMEWWSTCAQIPGVIICLIIGLDALGVTNDSKEWIRFLDSLVAIYPASFGYVLVRKGLWPRAA